MFRTSRSVVALLALLGLSVLPACRNKTQNTGGEQVSVPTKEDLPAPVPTAPGPEMVTFDPKQPQELLKMSLQLYRDLNDFQVDVARGWRTTQKGRGSANLVETTDRFTVQCQKPNQFALRGADVVNVVSDGRRRFLYVPGLDKYSDAAGPETLQDLFDSSEVSAAWADDRPLLIDLLSADGLERLIGDAESISYLGMAALSNEKVHRIRLLKPKFDVELVFSAVERPLLLQVAMTERLPPAPTKTGRRPTKPPPQRTLYEVYQNWMVDQRLIAFAFRYSPPETATRVSSLIWELNPAGASPLLGRFAPTFNLPQLDGSTFTVGDFRERSIVLLSFWSTRMPDAAAHLNAVRRSTDEFLGKDVVTRTVNLRERSDKVLTFLSQNALDVPVALDGRGRTGYLYRVGAQPVLFLIDKQGRVRSAHQGASDDLHTRLRAEVDALVQEDNLDSETLANINEERSVTDLIESLEVPDNRIRNRAVELLVGRGQIAVPALVEALSSRDAGVRLWSVTSLGRMGGLAEESVPDLVRMLEDRDPHIRLAAAVALGEVGAGATPKLIELMKGGTYAQKLGAIRAASGQREQAAKLAPVLIGLFQDPVRQIREASVEALSELGDAAVGELSKAVADDEPVVYQSAGDALGGMGESAVDPLLKLLKHVKPHVRYTAAIALGKIGPDAQSAVDQLEALTRDEDPNVRFYALQALQAVQ